MTETIIGSGLLVCSAAQLDLKKTFECGQCFRWQPDGNGGWVGVASGRAARLWERNGQVYIDAPEAELPFWRHYFDLETDYDAARRSVEINDYMRACASYGAGIRILCQDRWEALCSFIISQCNNIPRIMGIVERLCALCGEPFTYGGETLYAFPPAAALAGMTPEQLAPIRSGYRAVYIIEAAKAVASGDTDLEALSRLPGNEARAELKKLVGVGDKVANCAVLFGLHIMDAFPIDTWMKKALRANFEPGFDLRVFGKYAGLAQQYIFYSARSEQID